MSLKNKLAHLVLDAFMLILCVVVGTTATDSVLSGLGLAVIVAAYGSFNFQQGAAIRARGEKP